MALEAGVTYINDLVVSNPPGTDSKSQGDDHLRIIKTALKNTFPNATGARKLSDPTGGAADTLSFTLFRNAAGSVNQLLASYVISGKNAAGAEIPYARLQGQIVSPTTGAEHGRLNIRVPSGIAGVETTILVVKDTGVDVIGALTATSYAAITSTGIITATNAFKSVGSDVYLSPGTSGNVRLRPVAHNSAVGEMIVAATGDVTVKRDLIAVGEIQATQRFRSNGTTAVFGMKDSTDGTIFFRPKGVDLPDNQMTLNSLGNLTVTGAVISDHLNGGGTTPNFFASLSTPNGVDGTIYLRPKGFSLTTNQASLNKDGVFSAPTINGSVSVTSDSVVGDTVKGTALVVAGTLTLAGAYSGSGANLNPNGAVIMVHGPNADFSFCGFYNNGNSGTAIARGLLSYQAGAMSLSTLSDETLKTFMGAYDPSIAIDIIRADPVRNYTWNETGLAAVGWGAQTSYAVDPALAVPPMGGNEFWGMDYSKRAPYLWAALSWALDKIDELTTRIETLETT